MVIEPNFDSVLWFSEGLAAVSQDRLWGFIDKEGSFVIEPQFQEANNFCGGRAAVFDGEKWFLIDQSGQPVDFDYSHTGQQEAIFFHEGLATYRIENPSSQNDFDKQLYGYVDGQNYLIDQEGKRAFPDIEPRAGFTEFQDGMALWFLDDGSATGQYYLCNTKGEVVFRFPKEQGEPLYYDEGLIVFRNGEGKYGAMDIQGKIIVPPVLSMLVGSMGGVLEAYNGGQIPFYIRNPLWTGE